MKLMTTPWPRLFWFGAFMALALSNSPFGGGIPLLAAEAFPGEEKGSEKPGEEEISKWDIESAPGPKRVQAIDSQEGTWINLDLSPDGSEIVFDFLGDLYLMPVEGAAGEGEGGHFPEKLTEGVAWDMQPRFSPDGSWIAFTSDRTGKSEKAGDNIWLLRRADGTLRQITDESYRLMSGPAWTPDGEYLVARKHFTSRRALGAGEMWLYHWAGVAGGASAGTPLTSR